MEVTQFLLATDLADLDIVAESAPIELKQPIYNEGHRDSNWGIAPICIYDATDLAGNIQGLLTTNANEAADIHKGTGIWQNIDGGDLAAFVTGGCTALFAPFTHIRLNVTAGTCKARIWK